MDDEFIPILEGLVRIGTVSDTDQAHHKVRVLDRAADMTTGWLYVLQRGDDWFPAVNDTVLAVFLPVHDGDGFVIGGVG